ncbi:hypothetical protein GGI43DRAFT_396544 [Trichoderma evansii]
MHVVLHGRHRVVLFYFLLFCPIRDWPPAGVTTKNRSGGPLIRRIMYMLQQYPAHKLSCWVSSADGDSSMPSESRQLSPAWLRVFP